jgi:hypothetical protein
MRRADGFLTVNALGLTALLLSGCGIIATGSGGSCQAPTNASIVATGSFATNADSITGSVAIYELATGSYELVMSAFSGPSDSTSLYVSVVDSTGAQDLYTPLTGSSGDYCYDFSTSNTSFSLVNIKSNSTTVVAQAAL